MDPMQTLGRALLMLGLFVAMVGLFFLLAPKMAHLPFGRLPGDFVYKGKNITIFAPLGTMLVVSLVLTLLLNLFFRH